MRELLSKGDRAWCEDQYDPSPHSWNHEILLQLFSDGKNFSRIRFNTFILLSPVWTYGNRGKTHQSVTAICFFHDDRNRLKLGMQASR